MKQHRFLRLDFPSGIATSLWAFILASSLSPSAGSAGQWKVPEITLPEKIPYPFIACTPVELSRLRSAYKSEGRAQPVVAAYVKRAGANLGKPIVFPPRGGQHNQWYQCDKCQIALKTVDDTHHQCPRCKKVYTGEPYDDVIFSRKHYQNLSRMLYAAWSYALTGEETYATDARKILCGYAERYRAYPYHSASRTISGWGRKSGGHLFEQTLTEAAAFTRYIAPAYDLIRASEEVSSDDLKRIRSGLILPLLKNTEKNKSGKSNWQTWHNAAMLLGGAVLEDPAWIRKAIAQPGNGFAYQMTVSVSDDGMWYENSWGYHYYTLSAMLEIVEGARRIGFDLWHHPVLRKMFTIPVEYGMADGSLPRFGDDVHSTVGRASHYLEPAYAVFQDETLLPWLSQRPTFQSVMFGRKTGKQGAHPPAESRLFPSAGHAVLRTAGEAGLSAAFTFGPYGGFHGHFDKLGFVFFGCGEELGVDPGRARSQAYRLPIHRNWYKATVSHNTVLVDGRSQKPASGALMFFAANKQYAAVGARCMKAYPGVSHFRTLCMTPSYLLVLDVLSSEKTHRYDWLYHNRGTGIACSLPLAESVLSSEMIAGSSYIKNNNSCTASKQLHLTFKGRNVDTHLFMAEVPDTLLRTGDGVGASVLERVPLVIASRSGKNVVFATVLQPVKKAGTPTVTDIVCEHTPAESKVAVQNGGAKETFMVAGQKKITVMRGAELLLE